jgi:hypothetical protein
MGVPCHEPTENQRRYRERERKKRAAGALEPARLAHAHDLAQDQAQMERSGVNQEPLQNAGVVAEMRAPHAAGLVKDARTSAPPIRRADAEAACRAVPSLATLCAMPATFEEAFAAIKKLVADFRANEANFLSPAYQEQEVRNDFINKFFFALGWDVYHDLQKNPFRQEVKLERGVAMGASERKADYAFYVAPHFRRDNVRFFVEAKKPAGEIATPDNCFQTIRYGANAGTPLALLTSFRQLAVLDSRYKPDIETATKRVVRSYDYTEYAEEAKFREMFHLFSREAVAGGALEAFAESLPTKRGKAAPGGTGALVIGDAFLQELDAWRGTLARAFKNRNPGLDGETLTEITQRTLDRLVFLRFLEDKLIETKESVASLGRRGSAWQDFVAASRRLNGIYNGIVFRHHDRLDGPDFQVDDSVFADVCQWLSDPHSSYDFDKIPIHILGSIYERFLGKVIVTTDKRARVEEKPEVRKAGGVYYTPDYIVRYIVENTVGKLIKGKTPAQIAGMRFADIACGSGSFLLGVVDLLLHYHRDWFNAHPDKAKKAGCVLRDDGAWHLSLKQRREILLNNIYGVDIDHQAVEVAQLSLYLKLLEEETTASAHDYQLEFRETLLPSLDKNIVCGNSLIGTDISTGLPFDTGEERKLNPMDFQQRFPEIMKRGGFDAIVGNPPYIRIQRIPAKDSDYLFHRYQWPTSKMDLSLVFLERGLRLAKKQGLVGFICTSQWMAAEYGKNIRKELAKGFLHLIVDFGSLPVFANASTYPAILVLSPTPVSKLTAKRVTSRQSLNFEGVATAQSQIVSLSSLSDRPWTLGTLDIAAVAQSRGLRCCPLREFGKAYIGTKCGLNEAFVLPKAEAKRLGIEKGVLFPYAYRGAEVERYREVEPDSVIIYPYRPNGEGDPQLIPEQELKSKFPKAHAHLLSFKNALRERQDSRRFYAKGPDWYRHLRAGSFKYIWPVKLAVKGIAKRCSVGLLARETAFDGANCPSVILQEHHGHSPNYLLALLNSSLSTFQLKGLCPPKLSGYIRFSANVLTDLPIRIIDFGCPTDKARHDRMVALVEQMLPAQKQLAEAQSDADQDFYGNKCAGLDGQIDALVYELYGLTADEIKIVEGAAA